MQSYIRLAIVFSGRTEVTVEGKTLATRALVWPPGVTFPTSPAHVATDPEPPPPLPPTAPPHPPPLSRSKHSSFIIVVMCGGRRRGGVHPPPLRLLMLAAFSLQGGAAVRHRWSF
jgi:hypothetical protein